MPKAGRALPERCLRELARSELIVHAGDWVAESVVEGLEGIGPPVVGVHGNVDEEAVVRRLPAVATIELAGIAIAVIHAAGAARGRLRRLRKRFPDADAVVFGHSHTPLIERSGRFQIFNPGSPTERRRAPSRSMGLASLAPGRPPRFRHVEL